MHYTKPFRKAWADPEVDREPTLPRPLENKRFLYVSLEILVRVPQVAIGPLGSEASNCISWKVHLPSVKNADDKMMTEFSGSHERNYDY